MRWARQTAHEECGVRQAPDPCRQLELNFTRGFWEPEENAHLGVPQRVRELGCMYSIHCLLSGRSEQASDTEARWQPSDVGQGGHCNAEPGLGARSRHLFWKGG